jgi:hypoxanthine phosphoribosyltransferase
MIPMPLHDDIERVLYDAPTIQARVAELGAKITQDYAGKAPVLAGLLRGAAPFMVDLARTIDLPLTMDFMAASSYGDGMESQGRVRIVKDLEDSITGRPVILVEDIIDTGLTLRYIVDLLAQRDPASLTVCALLAKDRPRARHVDVAYTGFETENVFVVGYGLDYAQRYRNLPYIGILKPHVYSGAASNADVP